MALADPIEVKSTGQFSKQGNQPVRELPISEKVRIVYLTND